MRTCFATLPLISAFLPARPLMNKIRFPGGKRDHAINCQSNQLNEVTGMTCWNFVTDGAFVDLREEDL
jgi:hypothetical protein